MKKVAIIGGGINGVISAYYLARSGYQVTLYERDKLMSHTSSSSTKLIHGGLRYLEFGHFGLVAEALRDRHWWIKMAPDLVRPLKILVPHYSGDKRSRFVIFLGALVYHFLAGYRSLGRPVLLSRSAVIRKYPHIQSEALLGGVEFYDAQMDEEALGGRVISWAKTLGVEIVEGVEVRYINEDGVVGLGGNSRCFDFIVNAAGPWATTVLRRSGIGSNNDLRLVRGSHIILDAVCDGAFFLQARSDSRFVFVLPYKGRVLVGTTEVHHKNLDEEVACSHAETEYLLDVYRQLTGNKMSQDAIVETFAGLRPIVERRSHDQPVSDNAISREVELNWTGSALNIFGGKWTTAPSLGRKVVKLIDKRSSR